MGPFPLSCKVLSSNYLAIYRMENHRIAEVGQNGPAVSTQPTFFETAADFRAWLERNHASASELLVGCRKVSSGMPSMTWPESVDEALCFGWIDGVRKRIDDRSYQIRFTPRRRGSNWSLVNLDKVEKLLAQGRMHASGIAAFEARTGKKTGVYTFERDTPPELTRAQRRTFKENVSAWRYFETAPPGYRKVMPYPLAASSPRGDWSPP